MAEMDSLQTNIEDILASYQTLPDHTQTPDILTPLPSSSLITSDPTSPSRLIHADPIVLTIDGGVPLNVHLKVVNSYPIIFAFARGDGKRICFVVQLLS